MPAHLWHANFTAGELTPRMDARVDVAKYANGAQCIRNWIVQVHGGAARRAGTTFVAETKVSAAFGGAPSASSFETALGNATTRLIPFTFSRDVAYLCEFSAGAIRFFTARAPVAAEIANPYTADDLRELRYEQIADVLYLAHPNHAPQKLERVTSSAFRLVPVQFLPPPTVEPSTFPNLILTLSATTVGPQTAEAASAWFLAADVDRQIVCRAGRAVITTVTDSTHISLEILDAFDTVTLAAGDWSQEGSPGTQLTPSAKGPRWALATLTLVAAGWRTGVDEGRYVHVNGGILKLTSITSTTVATGQIVKVLTGVTASPAGAWTLEEPAWSTTHGFPGVVHFFTGRTWWAATTDRPDTVWASVVGDYENLGRGPEADDAIEITLAASEVNQVRWMKSLGAELLAGTVGGEYAIKGGDNEPISPSNVHVKTLTNYGADYHVDSIRVANVVLMLQRGATIVREVAFDFVSDSYAAPNLALLSEHLMRPGLVEMAHLRQPDSALLAVRADGALIVMTYERPEQVVAWSQLWTGDIDSFQSIAVIPGSTRGDEAYAVVRRSLPGGWRQYIEAFDGGLSTDAAMTYTGAQVTALSGLSHLEGLQTYVIIRDTDDGRPVWEVHRVIGGQIGLAQGTGRCEVGLPYTSTLTTLRPEIQTQVGTLQSRRQRLNEIAVRLWCSEGIPYINGERAVIPPDASSPYSGDVRARTLGWDREGRLTVEQLDPVPCTVLGIMASIMVDDG